MRLKLNTVVTRANLQDDGMASLVGELRPERWKVFQVMPRCNAIPFDQMQ